MHPERLEKRLQEEQSMTPKVTVRAHLQEVRYLQITEYSRQMSKMSKDLKFWVGEKMPTVQHQLRKTDSGNFLRHTTY